MGDAESDALTFSLAERRHPFVRDALRSHTFAGRQSYPGRYVCTCGWVGPGPQFTDHVAAAVVVRLEREGL